MNSLGNILFSLLASLLAHQSFQSFNIALEGWKRKNVHRLTSYERTILLFAWQRTPLCILLDLAYLWPPKRSGMWPREFTFSVGQTKPCNSNVWPQNQKSLNSRSTGCFGSNSSLLYFFAGFPFCCCFCLFGLFISTFTVFCSLVMKWDLSLHQGDQVGLFFYYLKY